MTVNVPAAISARTSEKRPVHLSLAPLCAAAAVVGVITGCGAWLFRVMISFVHNLFFLGVVSIHYRLEPIYTRASVGRGRNSCTRRRRSDRDFYRLELRSGG